MPAAVAAASPFAPSDELAELHAHLGGSVPPHVLWEIAHLQGIALPTKDYWEFVDLTSISDPRGVDGLAGLDRIYHLTELIQSSPLAVERSVYGMVGGGYRSQRITTSEVRFNPMKRNRGGERDLDHTILAAIHALDIAELAYPQVHAGLILMMDRTFSSEQNAIIVDKAIRYAPRGVVGVDIAGPRPSPGRSRTASSRSTCGPRATPAWASPSTSARRASPTRSARSSSTCGPTASATASWPPAIRSSSGCCATRGTVLEICPTSNLLTGALGDEEEVVRVFRTFLEGGVRVTVSTDGPEMMRTHLRDEFEFLCRIGALQPDEARAANVTAHEVRFGAPGRRSRRKGT